MYLPSSITIQNNQFRKQRTLEFWESYTSPMRHLEDHELDLVPSSETRNYILYAMAVLGCIILFILCCCCILILKSTALTNHIEPQIVPGAEQSLASLCDENCHHENESRFSKYCLCIGCFEWIFLEIREKIEGNDGTQRNAYKICRSNSSCYSFGEKRQTEKKEEGFIADPERDAVAKNSINSQNSFFNAHSITPGAMRAESAESRR